MEGVDSRGKCNTCSKRRGSWRYSEQPDSGKKKVAQMKKYIQLTQEERYLIGANLRVGTSVSAIARELGRHACTISREVKRSKTRHDGAYRAAPGRRTAMRVRDCEAAEGQRTSARQTTRAWASCSSGTGAPSKLPTFSSKGANCRSAWRRSTSTSGWTERPEGAYGGT